MKAPSFAKVRGRGYGRLALEGVVVVASILVAFILDAWWNDKELEYQLGQELASVAREVDENRIRVSFEINSLERVIAGSEAALTLLGAPPSQPVSIPDTLVWFVAFWSPTIDLSFGSLDALIASGRLAQISDPDLRLGLAGLRGRADDVVGDEMLAQSILMDQVFPAASQHADLSVAYRIDKEFFSLDRMENRPVPTEDAVVVLPSSIHLSNSILNRASWLGSALSELERLLVHLDSLSTMIEAGVN